MKPLVIAWACLFICAAHPSLGFAAGDQSITPPAGKLVIVKAEYGDLRSGASNDVTKKVARMVKNNTLTVAAENINFGDPAEGVGKKLKVDYILDGKAGSKTVAEGETLKIPADAK